MAESPPTSSFVKEVRETIPLSYRQNPDKSGREVSFGCKESGAYRLVEIAVVSQPILDGDFDDFLLRVRLNVFKLSLQVSAAKGLGRSVLKAIGNGHKHLAQYFRGFWFLLVFAGTTGRPEFLFRWLRALF